MHQREQRVDEVGVVGLLAHEPEFLPHARRRALVMGRKLADRVGSQREGLLGMVIQEGQEGLGQAREIPVRDAGLVAERIPA